MPEEIVVKPAQSVDQKTQIFDIRRKVFVEEQKVSEREEYDEFETSSNHLIAYINKEAVGTCRYRNTDKGIKLERFAVLKSARGLGIGEALVQSCLNQIDLNQYVYLHAQIQVVDFYAKYGFVQEGPLFVEADIDHYKMVYQPKTV